MVICGGNLQNARVAEWFKAQDLRPCGAILVGSNPTSRKFPFFCTLYVQKYETCPSHSLTFTGLVRSIQCIPTDRIRGTKRGYFRRCAIQFFHFCGKLYRIHKLQQSTAYIRTYIHFFLFLRARLLAYHYSPVNFSDQCVKYCAPACVNILTYGPHLRFNQRSYRQRRIKHWHNRHYRHYSLRDVYRF